MILAMIVRNSWVDAKGDVAAATRGMIEGGCGDKARVTIYRVRHRRRTVFARTTSFCDSYYGEYDYYVEARPGPGRYYAKVKRQLRPAVGWCRAARSPAEVLRRR